MYFEITPPKATHKQNKEQEPSVRTPILHLAPFTGNPKLFFENVAVGSNLIKRLSVQNPTPYNILLTITKQPPLERNVTVTLETTEIEPFGNTFLIVSWIPKKLGAWRDTVQVKTSNGTKHDVTILFKTSSPVKFKTCKRSSNIRTLRNNRPIITSKKVHTSAARLKKSVILNSPRHSSPKTQRSPLIVIQNAQGDYVQEAEYFNRLSKQNSLRRFTYLVDHDDFDKENRSSSDSFEKHIEFERFDNYNVSSLKSTFSNHQRYFLGNRKVSDSKNKESSRIELNMSNEKNVLREKNRIDNCDNRFAVKTSRIQNKAFNENTRRSKAKNPAGEVPISEDMDYWISDSTKISCVAQNRGTPRRETYSVTEARRADNRPLCSIDLDENQILINTNTVHLETNSNKNELNLSRNSPCINNSTTISFLQPTKNNCLTFTDETPVKNRKEMTFNSHSRYNINRIDNLHDKLNSDSFKFTPLKSMKVSGITHVPSVQINNENVNINVSCNIDFGDAITVKNELKSPCDDCLLDKLDSTEFCLTPVRTDKFTGTSCTPSFLRSDANQHNRSNDTDSCRSRKSNDDSFRNRLNIHDGISASNKKNCSNDVDEISFEGRHPKYSLETNFSPTLHSSHIKNTSTGHSVSKEGAWGCGDSAHSTPFKSTFNISEKDLSSGTYVVNDRSKKQNEVSEQRSFLSEKNAACDPVKNIDKYIESISPISIPAHKNVNTEKNYSGRAAKNTIEANLWAEAKNSTFDASPVYNRRQLDCIQEESRVASSYGNSIHYPDSLSDVDSVKSGSVATNRTRDNSRLLTGSFESIPRGFVPVKRKSQAFFVSPPKRIIIQKELGNKMNNYSWNKQTIKCDKHLLTTNMKLSPSPKLRQELRETQLYLKNIVNPDPFSATMTIDPFLSNNLYYEERWIQQQEMEFTKWLNALLTPPAELDCKLQRSSIDVAKLWEDCRKKNLIIAPTKETVSSRYHNSHHLNSLRKAACNLAKTQQVTEIFSKITIICEKKQLVIRNDRDLHLDVGLQSIIMNVLLSYYPLWLRVGLETIFGEPISLSSNSDIYGLTTFMMLRLFRDPYLLKKHSSMYLPAYSSDIKKFTLKKFLMLVYFLDYAKSNKLIKHDPCLFCVDAPIKESREILLSFSRELLSGVGDVTKYLKSSGYIVHFKQSTLDEFDYAVKNLGIDLRDGVRLTRVMELILMRDNLIKCLRVPAVTKSKKIYNVKIALDALQQSGFEITGDIQPKDIVDGHREKTLSLLWQLIYKFRAPRFVHAAETIQRWWRSLKIIISRRIAHKKWEQEMLRRKTQAAVTLQKYFRAYLLMQNVRYRYRRMKHASVTIQKWFRATIEMRRVRHSYLVLRNATITIQRYWKNYSNRRRMLERYIKIERATVTIQTWYKKMVTRRKITEERKTFIAKRESAVLIQNWFRATLSMKQDRKEYLYKITALKTLQRHIKATLAMKSQREEYLKMKNSTIIIQRYVKSYLLMKRQREKYLNLKRAAQTLRIFWRSTLAMRHQRKEFLKKQNAVRIIQCYARAYLNMRKERERFRKVIGAIKVIQIRWRATLSMRRQRNDFLTKIGAIRTLQRHIRTYLAMKKERESYLKILDATKKIQVRLRSTLLMRRQRKEYLTKLDAIRTIQCRFRAYLTMKKEREQYLEIRNATKIIQVRLRSTLSMRRQREEYLKQLNAIRTIQCRMRACLLMKRERKRYSEIIEATKIIQIRWRSTLLMRRQREQFTTKLGAIRTIQRHAKGYLAMKKQKKHYLNVVNATKLIQIRWRSTLIMRQQREEYLIKLNAIKTIQCHIVAYLIMKKERERYLKIRNATKIIQVRWRSTLSMRRQREDYLRQLNAVRTIQRRMRAYLDMKREKNNYVKILDATKTIQTYWRSKLAVRSARDEYLRKYHATLLLQTYVRATLEMRRQREKFQRIVNAARVIQVWFKSTILMKRQRNEYVRMVDAVRIIQIKIKGWITVRKQRAEYLKMIDAVKKIQKCYRQYKLRQEASESGRERRKLNKAASVIQAAWRGHVVRRDADEKLKEACSRVQRLASITQPMPTIRERYKVAVDRLMNGTMIDILEAINALDNLTRICPMSIDFGVELINHLYLIIASCNRSIPHRDASCGAVSVLINLATFQPTKNIVWMPKCIEIILNSMLVWCDKEGLLFPYLCTLLWLFCQDANKAKVIMEYPQAEKILLKIYIKTKRFQTMLDKKVSKSKNKHVLPAKTFDWNLVNRKQPRTFRNSLYAITSVLKKVHVQY